MASVTKQGRGKCEGEDGTTTKEIWREQREKNEYFRDIKEAKWAAISSAVVFSESMLRVGISRMAC